MRSFQDNRWSIITPKYLYENTHLIFSLWITIGTLWKSDGEPNTISSIFFVLISRALLWLHSTTLFTPCWCSPDLPYLLNRDSCIIRILENVLILCICTAIVGIKSEKHGWTDTAQGVPILVVMVDERVWFYHCHKWDTFVVTMGKEGNRHTVILHVFVEYYKQWIQIHYSDKYHLVWHQLCQLYTPKSA